MVFIMCNAAESFVFTLTLPEKIGLFFGSIGSFYCRAWLLKYASSLWGYFLFFFSRCLGFSVPSGEAWSLWVLFIACMNVFFSFLPHLKMIRFYAVASEECRRVLVAMLRSATRM